MTAVETLPAAPVVSTSASAEPAPAGRASAADTVRAYVALTKPRIIELLIITTIPVMFQIGRAHV